MTTSIARRARSSRLPQRTKRPCAGGLSWLAVILAISIFCVHMVPGGGGMARADPSADRDQSVPASNLGLVAQSCANYCGGLFNGGLDLWLSLETVCFQGMTWHHTSCIPLNRALPHSVRDTIAIGSVVAASPQLATIAIAGGIQDDVMLWPPTKVVLGCVFVASLGGFLGFRSGSKFGSGRKREVYPVY